MENFNLQFWNCLICWFFLYWMRRTRLFVSLKVLGMDYHLFQRSETVYSVHTVCLCVLYGSHNKQWLFPYTAFTIMVVVMETVHCCISDWTSKCLEPHSKNKFEICLLVHHVCPHPAVWFALDRFFVNFYIGGMV